MELKVTRVKVQRVNGGYKLTSYSQDAKGRNIARGKIVIGQRPPFEALADDMVLDALAFPKGQRGRI